MIKFMVFIILIFLSNEILTNFVLNHFLQSFELKLELFSTSFLVNSLSAKIKIKNKAGLVAQSVMSAIVLIR